MDFDLIIIGSGPGGYVAAIRASQLGMKVGVVERTEIGGICLNWGCIPTKSLLKSSQVYEYMKHSNDYGIEVAGDIKPDFKKIVERSRNVAEGMSKGVQFLFKKNKIEQIKGFGKLKNNHTVEVSDNEKVTEITAKNIILATGASSKQLPNLKIDGGKIIGYREALVLNDQPKSMVIVGAGAIGCEFAYFYNSLGTKVTIIELLPNIIPLEDDEISKNLARAFKKSGISILLESSVESVETSGELCKVVVNTKKGQEIIEVEIVLSSVGITPNLEGIGIEELGIEKDKDKIKVDDYYKTNVDGIYAIGDIIKSPALAHVASAEGITCVEKIAGLNPKPINYNNIPGCIYTSPEVASVGMSEQAAINAGYEIKVGKFPFTASGKASASGDKTGLIKLIFDSKYGEILGAHFIGANVTEMIAEIVVARNLEATGHELIKSIHPHPTMSEAIMEAAAAAYGEVIHL
jgi:dihydrolipoamide dehydrogenase